MRVLVVGRDEAMLELLQSFLWDFGYETEVAADGLECCAFLREFVPDVVILDHEVLWGGSAGILARMRDDPVLAKTPVILIAERPPSEKRDSSKRPPIVGSLRTPVQLGDLLAQLRSLKRLCGSHVHH